MIQIRVRVEYSRLVEHVMGIWCLQNATHKSERWWQSHRFTRVGDCTLAVTKTTTLFNKKKVFARGPRGDESSNITSDKAATCPPVPVTHCILARTTNYSDFSPLCLVHVFLYISFCLPTSFWFS